MLYEYYVVVCWKKKFFEEKTKLKISGMAHSVVNVEKRFCYVWLVVPWYHDCIDGLLQDCSNSSALVMELLQYCTKPSVLWCDKMTWFKAVKCSRVGSFITRCIIRGYYVQHRNGIGKIDRLMKERRNSSAFPLCLSCINPSKSYFALNEVTADLRGLCVSIWLIDVLTLCVCTNRNKKDRVVHVWVNEVGFRGW